MFFGVHGPTAVVSDNHKSFASLGEWTKTNFDVAVHKTSDYHPNSNLSERLHRSFNSVLDNFDVHVQKYGFENWKDTLCRFCVAHNSLPKGELVESPYSILKNRVQVEISPPKFKQTPGEQLVHENQFSKKIKKVLDSRLKIKNTVFQKYQRVKIMFKGKPVRYGTVMDENDTVFDTCVRIKMGKQAKPRVVNKDFVA